jgi:hypothetical protein
MKSPWAHRQEKIPFMSRLEFKHYLNWYLKDEFINIDKNKLETKKERCPPR